MPNPAPLFVEVGAFIGLAFLLALSTLGLYAWRSSIEDRARMQQTIQDEQKVIEASKAPMQETQDTLEARLEEIRKQVAQVKILEQAARAIPQAIPGVQPVIVHLPQQAPAAQRPEPTRPAPIPSGESAHRRGSPRRPGQ
jgi:hypothetical protein